MAPNILEGPGLGAAGRVAALVAQWVVLIVLVLAALAAVYRWLPTVRTLGGVGSARERGAVKADTVAAIDE